MPDDRYIVLLNDALKDHLLRLDERARGRLREKFEFLENGFWDAGVRVKKLRGMAGRVVFEARMSRSDRLLFTLGRHRGRTAIYVWGLVSHDGISAGATRIAPGNAPFLDFEPLEQEERRELRLEAVPRAWESQEDVEEKVPEDYGPQKWLVLDEAEWRRLLALPDPAGFEGFLLLTREQEELLAAQPPILLAGTAGSGKTTLSVYYLLRGAGTGSRRLFLAYNPLLKSFAERIYDGLMAKRQDGAPIPRPRFAVVRELLREAADPGGRDYPPEREAGLAEFTRIFGDHRDRRKYDPELVWEEIRSIIKGSKLPLNPARYAELASRWVRREISAADRGELREYLLGLKDLAIGARAESFIQKRTSLKDYAGFLRALDDGLDDAGGQRSAVLDEVLRLVGKASGDFSSPLLSLEDYLALGKKRAPTFLYDRREIHAIAEYYQERLARAGSWDEIDLTKAALRRMDGGAGEFCWDLVVCDEIQDLTDVQIALLFRLAANPRAVVLTGDPRQIINPSGFRWEEVKNKLYERGLPAPAVHRLSLNFRCVGSIVTLANALLDIKASLIGLTDTEMREQWKFAGRPPLLLAGIPEEKVLPCIDFRGAGQVVLTRTVRERDRLKAALSTQLVFTIAEAKGLEFDTVFLWRFCAAGSDGAIWVSIAGGQAVEPGRTPHLRHELALLYVGVTRARNTLIFYDGEQPSAIWDVKSLSPLVFRASDTERLSELWRTVSSPAEWGAQGDYYLAHGQFAAAVECFRNAGDEAKRGLANAHLLMQQEMFAPAAVLFEAAAERGLAAECRERAGEWGAARRLWRAMGEAVREQRAAAHMHEQAGRFARAAREWEALGEAGRAMECWEKAGAWEKVARGQAAAGQFARAARLFEKAKLPREAADCLEKAGEAVRAADMYVQAGDFAAAARLYKERGEEEKLLRCYRELGDDLALGMHYEAKGDARMAREAYVRFAAGSQANRERLVQTATDTESSRAALSAGLRYSALSQPQKAGRLLLKAGELELAAEDFERAGSFDDLALCREQLGQHLQAARALEQSGLEDQPLAAKLHSLLYAHLTDASTDATKAAEALYEEAQAMRAAGRLVPALVRFRLLQDHDDSRELFLGLGWHDEAIRYFLEAQAPGQAQGYAKARGTSFSLEAVEKLIDDFLGSDSPGDKQEAGAGHAELFVALLERIPAGIEEDAQAAPAIEKLLAALLGHMTVDELPASLFTLLLARRASAAIQVVLRAALGRGVQPSARTVAFVEDIRRAAQRTRDPALSAAAAWAADRLPKSGPPAERR